MVNNKSDNLHADINILSIKERQQPEPVEFKFSNPNDKKWEKNWVFRSFNALILNFKTIH